MLGKIKLNSIFAFFVAFSFVLGGGVALNEYVLREKVKTLEEFILSGNFGLKQLFGYKIKCRGILGRECSVQNLVLLDALNFENVKITFKSLSTSRIIMKFSSNDISPLNIHRVLLPNNVEYTIDLKKENSKLGYINLSRTLNMEFSDFNVFLNLDSIVRDNNLRNLNILFTLRDHLTLSRPYEYSVDSFNINMIMKNKLSPANKAIIESRFKSIMQAANYNPHFNKNLKIFFENLSLMLDYKVNNLSMIIARENNDLKYFHPIARDENGKLNNSRDIRNMISSLNEAYSMVINVDKVEAN